MSGSSQQPLPSKMLCEFCISRKYATKLAHLVILDLMNLYLVRSTNCQVPRCVAFSSFLLFQLSRVQIFLTAPCAGHVLYRTLNVTDQISYPHKTSGKYTVLDFVACSVKAGLF
jgi:hypothetical protein